MNSGLDICASIYVHVCVKQDIYKKENHEISQSVMTVIVDRETQRSLRRISENSQRTK